MPVGDGMPNFHEGMIGKIKEMREAELPWMRDEEDRIHFQRRVDERQAVTRTAHPLDIMDRYNIISGGDRVRYADVQLKETNIGDKFVFTHGKNPHSNPFMVLQADPKWFNDAFMDHWEGRCLPVVELKTGQVRCIDVGMPIYLLEMDTRNDKRWHRTGEEEISLSLYPGDEVVLSYQVCLVLKYGADWLNRAVAKEIAMTQGCMIASYDSGTLVGVLPSVTLEKVVYA